MCFYQKQATAASAIIPAGDNLASQRQGDIEAKLRRFRAGAAANILTSPRGIPATNTMGGVPNAT